MAKEKNKKVNKAAVSDLVGAQAINQILVYEFNKATSKITLINELIPKNMQTRILNNNCIMPPVDTYQLQQIYSMEGTHRTCIGLATDLVTGMGYYFRNEKHRNFPKLKKFIKRPNTEFGNTFRKIISTVYKNKRIYGYGDLFIAKAFNTIQMSANDNVKNTFVKPVIRNGQLFKEIDKYVQFENKSGSGRTSEFYPYNGDPELAKRYIHRIGYNKNKSSYYPEPEYIPIIQKIIESYLIDNVNQDFFSNHARPDVVFVFTGGNISTGNEDKIKEYYQENLREFKGINNQRKTMVLTGSGKDAKIEIVDLSKHEDGQFSDRQQYLEYCIARSHRIQPKLASLLVKGSGGFQGGTGVIGELFAQNQLLLRPEQSDLEDDLNLVLESLFDFNPELKFRTVDMNNQKDLVVFLGILIKNKVIGLKEARKFIAEHDIMEINPEEIPGDFMEVSGISINSNTDLRDDKGNLETNQDDIYTVDGDKFQKFGNVMIRTKDIKSPWQIIGSYFENK